jgi:hypothetical protein
MRRLIEDNSNIDLSENFSEFQTLQSLLNTLKMKKRNVKLQNQTPKWI